MQPHVAIAPDAQAIAAWLEGAVNHERTGTFRAIRLDRIRAFLALLPAPPAPLTVAGTKGKGSTVRLIEAALRAHQLPTLAFTSPHVASVLERFRIDGAVASAGEVAEACSVVARLEHGREPLTYFEKTFAVACLLASARRDVSFLCEVGLGGRLDCANALDCAVAVITHLSHDHRDVLGPTLEHIAREKLAVARPGRPLLIAPQSVPAALALERTLRALDPRTAGQARWVSEPAVPMALALPGAHQQGNAATALAAVAALRPGLDPQRSQAGMSRARLAARCQLIEDHGRRLLIDGAHNGPSVAATVRVAQELLAPGWTLVLGLAQDKEVEEVLAVVPPGTPVRRCGYRSPRVRTQAQWPPAARAWPWHDTVTQALAAVPGGDLCVTGSFYLAGEALVALGQDGVLPG